MAERGTNCEIQVLIVGPKGTDIKYGLQGGEEDNSFALVVERRYDEKNKLDSTTLQVNSPHLLGILRALEAYYPALGADFDMPFVISSPFQMLYHYWNELTAVRETSRVGRAGAAMGDEARIHLNLLLSFMQHEMGPSRERVDSMVKAGSIGFSTLWTIFRPGQLVYTTVDGHEWLLRLEKTAYEENQTEGKFLELHLTYTDFDGDNSGKAHHIVKIFQKRSFAAENPSAIVQLPAYPADWLPNLADVESRLAKRGARFLATQGIQVRAYNGLARYLKERPGSFYDPGMANWPAIWLPYTESGRVILDRKTFREEHKSDSASVSATSNHDQLERKLCPPYFMGYSLILKEWCRFYVDSVSDISWDKSALESLVLSEQRKAVLEALVCEHSFPEGSSVRNDTKQKGKGLVILLHGSPGSGKTLTAESAAEVTGRALLTATLGELNQENYPALFERRLKKVLQYATIWRAVVLLDEADVFLEGRTEVTLEHNALVALFLKQLEYFSGIVFLTSNRVSVFDRAMKSRIHLALEYRSPDEAMRRRLWAGCLAKVPATEREPDNTLSIDIERFLDDDVNGREIANTVTTALTLARFKGEPLRADHIETVLQTRRDFEKRLDSLRKRSQKTDAAQSQPGPFQLARRFTLDTAAEDSD